MLSAIPYLNGKVKQEIVMPAIDLDTMLERLKFWYEVKRNDKSVQFLIINVDTMEIEAVVNKNGLQLFYLPTAG